VGQSVTWDNPSTVGEPHTATFVLDNITATDIASPFAENDGGSIAINPDRFDKLITAIRVAVENDETLYKGATSYNYIFMSLD
jgi:hypothetical protein